MFASWPFFPQFFERWFETADPAVLVEDVAHHVVPTTGEPEDPFNT